MHNDCKFLDQTREIHNECGSEEWYMYRDVKCFKLIEKWENNQDSELTCNNQYVLMKIFIPKLAKIVTPAEQELLTNSIFKELGIASNVWIGVIRSGNSSQFVWNDGSNIVYENRDKTSPSDDLAKNCVIRKQGLLSANFKDSLNGKWKDVSCR